MTPPGLYNCYFIQRFFEDVVFILISAVRLYVGDSFTISFSVFTGKFLGQGLVEDIRMIIQDSLSSPTQLR